MGFTLKKDAEEFVEYIEATYLNSKIDDFQKTSNAWWNALDDLNARFPEWANNSASTWRKRYKTARFYVSEEGQLQKRYIDEVWSEGFSDLLKDFGVKNATTKAACGEALTNNDLDRLYADSPAITTFNTFKLIEERKVKPVEEKQQQIPGIVEPQVIKGTISTDKPFPVDEIPQEQFFIAYIAFDRVTVESGLYDDYQDAKTDLEKLSALATYPNFQICKNLV
jgi:hypothetical protein